MHGAYFLGMTDQVQKPTRSQFSIDSIHGIIHKRHIGNVTVTEEMQMIDQVISDPTYRKGMNTLCDFTSASVAWSLQDLDTFRAYVTRIKKITGKCKWAILFPAGSDTSTARMFVALHEAFEDTIAVRIFADSKEALAWLQSGDDLPK